MNEAQQTPGTASRAEKAPSDKPPLKIHRVCIGCNQMFEVTMENYEAKHCPVCRKV
jgi:rRNA maturation endonuclease Nob1